MRPSEGEQVNVRDIGLCEVVSNSDPSLVTLKRPEGATLKIGERALCERIGGDAGDAATDGVRGERYAHEDE